MMTNKISEYIQVFSILNKVIFITQLLLML